MTRNRSFLALLAVASLAATGCASTFNGPQHALSVQEEHPITVDSQVVTLTISGADASGALSSVDRARLRAFANAYMNNGHGPLSITAPASDAAQSPLVATIRTTLDSEGVDLASVSHGGYIEGSSVSGNIILSYTHYVATPSVCGVWTGQLERDFRNMRSPNFGCATQNNLAAMIGDPRDLITPADMTSPDSQSRILGVEKFREGNVTASQADGSIETKVAN